VPLLVSEEENRSTLKLGDESIPQGILVYGHASCSSLRRMPKMPQSIPAWIESVC
jgi:hypothetical protein